VAFTAAVHQRTRLTDALRGRAKLRFADSREALIELLRTTTDAVDVVVIPAGTTGVVGSPQLVRDIIAQRPRAAIVAYCELLSPLATDVRALAAAGVHQFLFSGIDDHGVALRNVLAAARQQRAAERVQQRMASLVPPSLHSIVETVLARPDLIVGIRPLAAALGVHRKTLFNRCEREHFMHPAELLVWTRLALVGYLLETTGCTVETIALELAYPSPTALRNTLKRHTGRTARQLRERGGLAPVLDAFARRIADARGDPPLHLS
jgi:AraC-like DNA-binding protein